MIKKIVLIGGAATLVACGGDSGSNKAQEVDLRQYLIPAQSSVLSYDEYDVEGGQATQYGSYDESWQVFTNSAIAESSYGSVTIHYNSQNIDIEGDDFQLRYPRKVKTGKVYSDSKGDQFAAFIPARRTFRVAGSQSPSRTDDDTIVFIQRIDWAEDGADVEVTYASRGKGITGFKWFEFCPNNVKLSPDTNYSSLCDDWYIADILVD